MAAGGDQQGVAVGLTLGDETRAEHAGGARLVLDDDRLTQALRHLLPDQACHQVDAAAGREADHDANRVSGKVLGRDRRRAGRNDQSNQRAKPPQQRTHAYPSLQRGVAVDERREPLILLPPSSQQPFDRDP